MLNLVSVTSDGTRLFVTDLGHNRVLVWNSIPNANGAAADFALGQPDLTSATPNYGVKTDPADTTHWTSDLTLAYLTYSPRDKNQPEAP